MKRLLSIFAVISAFGLVNAGHASLVLDQQNGPGMGQFSTTFLWQQEVTAGVSGKLKQIDLFVIQWPYSFWLDLYATPGVHNDLGKDLLLSVLLAPEPDSGWNAVDVSAADLTLDAGQKFTFGIRGAVSGTQCCGLAGTSTPHDHPLYAAGDLYYYNGRFMEKYPVNDDLAFRTHMVVSEPGSLALVALGMVLVLIGAARKPAT